MSNTMRIWRALGAAALLWALAACGSAKVEVNTAEQPTSDPVKPFDAPALGEGGGGTSTTVSLSAEDEEITVPGSQYGGPPPIKQPAKKKKKGQVEEVVPYTDAVAEQMEGLEWGMTWKKVISIFEAKVRDQYAKELAATAGDALAEDQVRTKMLREMRKLKDSYIEFKGQRTGYEAGMIADEFTHNNGESMLQWDAGKYVEYLFFFNGRFWKRLRAFRKDSFSTDITFMTFLATLEARFGEGLQSFDDNGEMVKVAWRDETTFVDAVDRSKFYGAFGLRFTAAVTETYIDRLRTNKGRDTGAVGDDVSKLVDQVTSGKENVQTSGSSVIDEYTGGGTTTAPAADSGKGGKKKGEAKKEKAEEPAAEPAKKEEPGKGMIDDLF